MSPPQSRRAPAIRAGSPPGPSRPTTSQNTPMQTRSRPRVRPNRTGGRGSGCRGDQPGRRWWWRAWAQVSSQNGWWGVSGGQFGLDGADRDLGAQMGAGVDFQYLCEDLAPLCWGGPCAAEAVGGAGVVQDVGPVGEHPAGEVLRGYPLGLVVVLDVLGVVGVAGVVRGGPVAVLGAGVLGVDGHGRVVDRVRVGLCGLFRVGLTGAAGPHGLGRGTAGDLFYGVGDGPVGFGDASASGNAENVCAVRTGRPLNICENSRHAGPPWFGFHPDAAVSQAEPRRGFYVSGGFSGRARLQTSATAVTIRSSMPVAAPHKKTIEDEPTVVNACLHVECQ